MYHIHRCPTCNIYTLKGICACGQATLLIIPPKYSPEDKYAHYRRQVKKAERITHGLL